MYISGISQVNIDKCFPWLKDKKLMQECMLSRWFCFQLILLGLCLCWMDVSSVVLLSTRINTVPSANHFVLSELGSTNQTKLIYLTTLLPHLLRVEIIHVHRNWPSSGDFISAIQWKEIPWNEITCQKYKSKVSVQTQCVLASYTEFTTNSFGNLEERPRYMTANTDNRWVQTRPVGMGKSLKILCHIFLVYHEFTIFKLIFTL